LADLGLISSLGANYPASLSGCQQASPTVLNYFGPGRLNLANVIGRDGLAQVPTQHASML